jgi:protein-disulfide isomerase
MIFRIFITIIALFCVYIAYDSAVIAWGKFSAHKVENGAVQAPADADISVVEFLDYSCVHCQDFHPVLMRALERDGKIRYIVKPVLPSGASDEEQTGMQAAELAYAAGRQGKFIEAHNILIENFRTIDEDYVRNLAEQLGLDADQLLADMRDPDIRKTLERNRKNLARIKGRFVPSLLVNNKVLLEVTERMPSNDELLGLFNRARTL